MPHVRGSFHQSSVYVYGGSIPLYCSIFTRMVIHFIVRCCICTSGKVMIFYVHKWTSSWIDRPNGDQVYDLRIFFMTQMSASRAVRWRIVHISKRQGEFIIHTIFDLVLLKHSMKSMSLWFYSPKKIIFSASSHFSSHLKPFFFVLLEFEWKHRDKGDYNGDMLGVCIGNLLITLRNVIAELYELRLKNTLKGNFFHG